MGISASQGGNEEESGWPDRRSLGKNERELEAEAVAYLVGSRAELVTGSATYLKPYAQRADMKNVDVELIVRAAARIERLAKIHHGSMAVRPEKQGRTICCVAPLVMLGAGHGRRESQLLAAAGGGGGQQPGTSDSYPTGEQRPQ